MLTTDFHWLVGLLEGEGCFISGTEIRPNSSVITVAMTDKDTIEHVANLFETTTCYAARKRNDNWNTVYITSIHGEKARYIMRLILPFLGKRRKEKICQVLSNYDNSEHTLKSVPLTFNFKPITELSDEEKDFYWLVGLLEGEGSFMKGSPSNPNSPIISIAMTDEDIIRKISVIFNKSYFKRMASKNNPKHKDSYQIRLRGQPAIELMKKLKPLMSIRRQQQIELAVQSYDPKRKHVPKKLTAPDVIDIYTRSNNGESYAKLANEYGINRKTAYGIKNKKAWTHITCNLG